MHDERKLTEDRLQRVLRERIRPAVYPLTSKLDVEVWHVPGEPVDPAEGLSAQYSPAAVGDKWGPPWGTSWFRFRGTVPAEWSSRRVEAVIDLGFSPRPGFSAEGLMYLPDGTAVKGLHPHNQWLPIADAAVGGETVTFYLEAASNPEIHPPITPMGDRDTAGDEPLYQLVRADLAVFEPQVWELVQDLDVLGQLMCELPEDQPRRWQILRAISRCLDAVDLQDVVGSAAAARACLAPVLEAPAVASAHVLSGVGHAHIDSAWLWPLRETVRKVARTASNTVRLMDDHPEFVFAMSQAQQLAWIKQHRPEVYARVKEKVAAGQFVPVGGMWVESDTNMPGAEAMARQFSHGKRFFLDEFGVETEEVWLPDSFGYSAALPQLVKLSGSRWFLTQKISWSQTNRFPHHSFWWEGLDGTRVFTHFPPIDTYNSEFSGREVAHAVRNFRDKGGANRSLAPFGHGDGGGGPTREMLARARRLRDLEGSARVEIEKPADFFAKAEAEYADAPVWNGELYLEYHRATYTSQAKTKQGNRRSEHLLREAELWSALAAVRVGFDYPYRQLDQLWKTVLLHQFHDILPGSSIAWVHREAAQTYADVARQLRQITTTAQQALAGDGDDEIVFNAAPHPRGGVPAGAATPRGSTAGGARAVVDGEGWALDNDLLRVGVDARGLITSIYDRHADRETVAPGQAANLLQIHPDLPNNWDAWDVDSFYRNTVVDVVEVDSIEVVDAEGPTARIRVRRSFSNSTATQLISLSQEDQKVEVTTTVDWHEREKFLKAAFPLDVRAADMAAETQFGHLRRPAHANTSWDAAKFEVCAHRFVHVAEPGWGVALVNDSTYGHDVTRTVRGDGGTTTTVRLSLLRAPRFPDPEADQGEHTMSYAIVPGAEIVDAVREGYRINLPERSVTGGSGVAPLIGVDDDRAVVESLKLADDASGDVVVRLYEASGGRAAARVKVFEPLQSATIVDLLERRLDGGDLEVIDDSVALRLRPFEIVTLRLRLRR